MQKENISCIIIQVSHYHKVSNDVYFESKMNKAMYLPLDSDCKGSVSESIVCYVLYALIK